MVRRPHTRDVPQSTQSHRDPPGREPRYVCVVSLQRVTTGGAKTVKAKADTYTYTLSVLYATLVAKLNELD